MITELRLCPRTEAEREKLDQYCRAVGENMQRLQDARVGVISYPPEMIESVCNALGYDDHDRQYMAAVFKRHETGEATKPERLLLHLLIQILTSQAIGAPTTSDDLG